MKNSKSVPLSLWTSIENQSDRISLNAELKCFLSGSLCAWLLVRGISAFGERFVLCSIPELQEQFYFQSGD